MPTLLDTFADKPVAAEPLGGSALPEPVQPPSLMHSEAVRLAGTVFLYSFAALLFIRSFYIVDPDIWWHLRTGDWIWQHHSLPATDPFSSYGADKPWIVYSWLFDTFLSVLYGKMGLVAIAIYDVAVRVALTVALFHLVRTLLRGFWRPAALTGLGIYSMTHIVGPRPGMLTILFVIFTFDILLTASRTGRTRLLWLLPPLFALWANWHIQFVYGLFVVGVFAAEPILNALLRYRPAQPSMWPLAARLVTLATSAAATLVNPYGAKIYSTVFLYAGQTRVYNLISEFLAMNFREPQHYVALALTIGAAMAIGWRRDARPLWIIFLAATSILAFRSVREIWFLAVVAVCVAADGWPDSKTTQAPRTLAWRSHAAIAVWVVALLIAACRRYGLSDDALFVQTAGTFPEAAVRYIETNHLEGPLFNDLSWGGYLIWRLPELPVALDGRTNVHGEDRILRISRVWLGKPNWSADPDLNKARLVLTPRDAAIASLLRSSKQFRIAFEDPQAVIFERRN